MTEYAQKYKRLNRKKRKLELIRRRNKIRQWPECWHGEFYTNHDINSPHYSGGWVDFWFYTNQQKTKVAVVSMETVRSAAELEALDETLANAEPTLIAGVDSYVTRLPLMDNEYFYKEREIQPKVSAWRKSDVVTRVLATTLHDKITENDIHGFIDAYRRDSEFRTRVNASEKAKSWEVKFPAVKVAAKRRPGV